MLVLDHEQHVTTRPITHPLGKIFLSACWALAYARHHHASCCRCGPFATPLPMTPLLLPPPLLPAGTGPITPAGLLAPPTPSRLPTINAAITCLGMGRTEGPFTAFEETTSLATKARRLLSSPTKMMQ
jgi:hypothetical protein